MRSVRAAQDRVFVVHRVEDRHEPDAEKFALKVPDYSASAARLISEAEFQKMFRDEASALLAIPSHPNLARFVTFDLAARPKPILVMELVEGATLEHAVEARALDMTRCFALLDGVLSGLEAMHDVGVGHLDRKPGNVVLREGRDPVLVDFGLSGRHIRPGCATGPYGAPEVWGAEVDGAKPTAQAADVYAFGCLAFETLTGWTLFDADSEIQQVAMHLSHDGLPGPVARCSRRASVCRRSPSFCTRRSVVRRKNVRERERSARRAEEDRSSTFEPKMADRGVMLAPVLGVPDPDGADCVACGRCCHHGPRTVHLLESDDARMGKKLLALYTEEDQTPPGWRFMKNSGNRCGKGLDVYRNQDFFRAPSTPFAPKIAASWSPARRVVWKHATSVISGSSVEFKAPALHERRDVKYASKIALSSILVGWHIRLLAHCRRHTCGLARASRAFLRRQARAVRHRPRRRIAHAAHQRRDDRQRPRFDPEITRRLRRNHVAAQTTSSKSTPTIA